MSSTPETKVKRVVTKYLKEMGAYYFYPVTGGYGRSGVPDIIGCHKGKFFGIVCKAGKNKPTSLQDKNLHDIGNAGGIALVINESNMHSTTALVWGDSPSSRRHTGTGFEDSNAPVQLEFDFGE